MSLYQIVSIKFILMGFVIDIVIAIVNLHSIIKFMFVAFQLISLLVRVIDIDVLKNFHILIIVGVRIIVINSLAGNVKRVNVEEPMHGMILGNFIEKHNGTDKLNIEDQLTHEMNSRLPEPQERAEPKGSFAGEITVNNFRLLELTRHY